MPWHNGIQSSIHSHIEWDEGKDRVWGWDLLIVYLTLGTLLNAFQLLAHIWIKDLRKQATSTIITWLAAEDFLFDLFCLIQCSMNRDGREFVGHDTLCLAQAVWAEFLMSLSGLTLVSLMYTSWSALVLGKILDAWHISKVHIFAAIYCLFVSLLTNLGPGRGQLNSSGLYCFTNGGVALDGAMFHVLYALPVLGLLVFFCHGIWTKVTAMTTFLAERDMAHVGPRPAQVRMAKLMSVYIVAFLIVLLPFEAVFFYSWVTADQAPATMWVVAAVGGHFLTFSSPILYYVLNARARAALRSWACSRENKDKGKEDQSKSVVAAAPTRPYLLSVLRKPHTFQTFLEFAKTQYCPETLTFWQEIQRWKERIQSLTSPADDSLALTPPESKADSIMSSFREQEDESRSSNNNSPTPSSGHDAASYATVIVQALAVNIYDTFLRRAAPLEVNISAEDHNAIVETLCISDDNKTKRCISGLRFSDNLLRAFDSIEEEILILMEGGVFRDFLTRQEEKTSARSKEIRSHLEPLRHGNVLPMIELKEGVA